MIEVSHGDGLGGSSFNYGFSRDRRVRADRGRRRERRAKAKLAVLLLPGIGTREDLDRSHELGVSVARIATHCTEADVSPQHIGLARELGHGGGRLPDDGAHERAGAGWSSRRGSWRTPAPRASTSPTPPGRCCPTASRRASRRCAAALPADSGRLPRPREPVAGGREHARGRRRRRDHGRRLHLRPRRRRRQRADRGARRGLESSGIETGIDVGPMLDAAEEVVRPIMARPQMIDRARLCWATPASTRASSCTPSAPPSASASPSRTSWSRSASARRSAARRT